MRSLLTKLLVLLAIVVLASWTPSSARQATSTGQGPALTSMGPLAFGPDGTLFAADNQAAAIFALDLGAQANGGAAGAKGLDAVNEKLAALLGTGAREITITDLAVHPRTRNAYLSVMRGQGEGAAPALFRVDGNGAITMVSMQTVRYQKVELPNAPAANPTARQNPRTQVVTDMAFADGRLWVAGLSNEEFASNLRAIPYPFASVDTGTSVEIYHGNHRQLETRSPVNAFVPYMLNNQPHLIAGYTCTPLVKFPIASLRPGDKVRGTTIAEFGAGNRVLDMIVYRKGGQEFLLTANNSRGVMKIPTSTFASATPITTPVETETGGVPFEKVTSMTGIRQLDKLDDSNSIVIAQNASGALNLQVVPLP
ncbi:MAG: hypothetical protein HY657_09930 [Acidobacteria bacterium]|nr:hypothetical protein [Acidobacteriota bacterium]